MKYLGWIVNEKGIIFVAFLIFSPNWKALLSEQGQSS